MSRGEKVFLIKAILQAIPSRATSIYRLPMRLCHDIHSIIQKFLWGSSLSGKGVIWISWDKTCLPKSAGGMGFKNQCLFNQALLAKQGWRIVKFPNSLLAKVLRTKYVRRSNFLNAKPSADPSYIWRSLLFGRELLK